MLDTALSRAFLRQAVIVCVASALLGASCGSLAGDAYTEAASDLRVDPSSFYPVAPGPFQRTGTLFGLLTGLVGAALWFFVMRCHTLKLAERPVNLSAILMATATGMGLLAGVIATFLLHLGLTMVSGVPGIAEGFFVGLFFGVPSGLFLGLICGFLWWFDCSRAHRTDLWHQVAAQRLQGPSRERETAQETVSP